MSEGRKAINDYKKAIGDVSGALRLMVYYVQCGNDFTLEFGDIDKALFDSVYAIVEGVQKRPLTEADNALASEFLTLLEQEFERIDGQMGWATVSWKPRVSAP